MSVASPCYARNPTMAIILETRVIRPEIGKGIWGPTIPTVRRIAGFRRAFSIHPHPSLPFRLLGNDYFDDVYMHNGKENNSRVIAPMSFQRGEALHSRIGSKENLVHLATIYMVPSGPRMRTARRLLSSADPKFDHLNGGLENRLSLYLGMIRNIDWNMGKLMKSSTTRVWRTTPY